jgi:transposase
VALLIPCSLQISGTGTPLSASFKIDSICVSLNLDFFIENLLIIFYWNFLLMGRLVFWEDYLKSPYKKYLDLNIGCKATFTINKEKLKIDEKLDGIKGFITNDFTLSHSEIIEHYINLHFIEKAFRISKTDLKIRPIYHRLENRIKAHILLSFIAYAVYKEFERRLSLNNVKFNFSQKIIFDLIKDMKAIEKDDSFKIFKFNSYQEKIYKAVFNT